MKEYRKIQKYIIINILILFFAISISSQTDLQAAVVVTQTDSDKSVIPDKYNTGYTGTLTTIPFDAGTGGTFNGIQFIPGAGNTGTRCVLDFGYRNKSVSGTVTFENYDFSGFPFWSYNEGKVDRKIKVVFKNCKFSSIAVGKTKGNLSFEFHNCSINSFSGSNTKFYRCQFGNSYSDGLVPFCNIELNDCFFKDMASVSTTAGVHTDGTQLYGIAGTDVQNVVYRNCRFEVPPLRAAGSSAYINACIMFQLEYSSAKDVTFQNCIVNGGGYSIYARSKDNATYTVNNVTFDGVKFGDANKFGIFYTDINRGIKITDVSRQDALYVGSVWKSGGKTHFSVTNDTNRQRTLLIYTNKGKYTYTIPACPTGSQMTESMTYKDMPFDMDIAVPADCSYAVCFDSTTPGYGKQIRFVNWGSTKVTLDDASYNSLYSGSNDILVSGTCGKNISFTLTKAGVLTLSGTGSTYNYHSQKFPEWSEYEDYIKEIRVGEGITGLGSMIFRKCSGVEKVKLPDSLTGIGQYGFGGCVSLDEFVIPANIQELGKSVFSGTPLSQISYAGKQWDKVIVGTGNDNLLERLIVVQDTVQQPDIEVPTGEVSTTQKVTEKVTENTTQRATQNITQNPTNNATSSVTNNITENHNGTDREENTTLGNDSHDNENVSGKPDKNEPSTSNQSENESAPERGETTTGESQSREQQETKETVQETATDEEETQGPEGAMQDHETDKNNNVAKVIVIILFSIMVVVIITVVFLRYKK